MISWASSLEEYFLFPLNLSNIVSWQSRRGIFETKTEGKEGCQVLRMFVCVFFVMEDVDSMVAFNFIYRLTSAPGIVWPTPFSTDTAYSWRSPIKNVSGCLTSKFASLAEIAAQKAWQWRNDSVRWRNEGSTFNLCVRKVKLFNLSP